MIVLKLNIHFKEVGNTQRTVADPGGPWPPLLKLVKKKMAATAGRKFHESSPPPGQISGSATEENRAAIFGKLILKLKTFSSFPAPFKKHMCINGHDGSPRKFPFSLQFEHEI